MATLRDEWLMAKCLKTLERADIEEAHGDEPDDIRHALLGAMYISQSVLINLFLEERAKDPDRRYWYNLTRSVQIDTARRILEACKKDGFVEAYSPPSHSTQTLWRVTETDGDNLLMPSYYWFKYFPRVFPEPARLLFSVFAAVITAALTSGVLWALLLGQ
ncbi:MAG TPA: hypothetical protein VI483_03690 [Candidatus Paceibacterota bacterium]